MEADWDEIARVPFPPPSLHTLATPVSTFAFDTAQELLWAANEYGRITSFYGLELQKYTSYKGHSPQDGPVKQLLFCDKGVLSVAPRSLHLSNRRGLSLWHLSSADFKDLRCMHFTLLGTNELLVAGCQDTMFKIDVEKGAILETVHAPEKYTIMKRAGHYICAATSTGSVHLLDPNSLTVVKDWRSNLGWVNDMDATADFLVTCGYSPRQQLGYMLDPLANVFDLKTLMPLPPIPFQPGAAFVRMHPRMSTTCVVASQNGQIQVVDIMNPNTVNVRQANIFDTYLLSLELAPSGEALALTDSACSIHLWGSMSKAHFTKYSSPTEFPDSSPPLPDMDWSPDTPLNVVGMPYYREALLSIWPTHTVFDTGAPPIKIDPDITKSLQLADIGGYAPNPRKTRRYQVENTRTTQNMQNSLSAPRFLSEKARHTSEDEARLQMSDLYADLYRLSANGGSKPDELEMYRKVEIKYSKFGVDDFDFDIQGVPTVLMINTAIDTAVHSSHAKELWSLPKWLPHEIGIIVDQGQFFCFEGQDLKLHLQRGVYTIVVYELVGLVADINVGENNKSHLVSMINVGPSSRDPSRDNQWFIFNDFLVQQVSMDEALRFEPKWKLPSVLAYQVKSASHVIDDSWKENLDPSLLYRRWTNRANIHPNDFRLLSHATEVPRPGMPVAIDAEFVKLQSEEIEVKADGSRETILPSRSALARVSVLRGAGPDQGISFIDDYIAISEPIVDHLTEYSGIQPGDLDRTTSKHTLVSLKVAYKKLWLLLNLGCVFVGHGLLKDFRIINIHVPRAQVVDTVNLFFIQSRQRKLNLRFLAWYLLKEDIQTGMHDSVEDARTALRLWKKYQEFQDAGVLEQMLEEVYRRGREVGFKAPGAIPKDDAKKDAGGTDTPDLLGDSTPGTPRRRPVTLAFSGRSGLGGSPMGRV
ncbi:MAG: poly(A)-specific ribonuclease [Bathelium mastoideum]|nr:MAG: poly(A)-specific ribonuclease [Bathelium mastoideum]